MCSARVRRNFIRPKGHRDPAIDDFAALAKVRRGDPDDRVRFAVVLHGEAQDLAVTAKDALPETITQDSYVILTDRVFFRRKESSDPWLVAVDIEVMCGRSDSEQPLWFAFSGQIELGVGIGGQVLP